MTVFFQEIAQLMSSEGVAVSLQSVQIEGQVTGLLLSLRARQHYKNTGADYLEVVYTFPLPWGATLLGLHAEIDGHRLHGTVMEKTEATQAYEKALDAGDTPIMVERSARGLYTANLGNLKPGESAVIEIEYAQLLRFEQGQVRITLPTTVAPRYGDAHQTGGLAPHESVEPSLLVEYPLTVNLLLTGDAALASVQCPSHGVALARQDDGLLVKLQQGGFLDRDVVLLLQDLQGQSFASVAPDGEGFAVLASFCPVVEVPAPIPLLLKILVDCSGSMAGDSITAARQALYEIVQELKAQDWVSYSRFGSTVVHDLAELTPCKPANIKRVARFIANTDADLGGTEMNAALISTFNKSSGPDLSARSGTKGDVEPHQDVLLITDGDIWDVEAVIESAKASGHRIFAIGVGSAPGESLLREVAEKTGGACELVSPTQSVADVIVRMFHRLRSPCCSNLTVDWGQAVLWQSALPSALYGGDTLHLCARLAMAPLTPPTLSWVANDTAMQAHALQLQQADALLLPRLVAAQQVAECESDHGSLEQIKELALTLALRYQLISQQTNLILVHVRAPDQKAEGLPALEQIAPMQAAGWGGAGGLMTSTETLQFSRRQPDQVIMRSHVASPTPSYASQSSPSVWRTRDRSAAAAKIDSLSSGGIDEFEVPAFLRNQSGDRTSRSINPKAITTPLELLKAFDAMAGKILAGHRFVGALQTLHIPVEISKLVDEFTVVLGTGAKAWAVVVQWLSISLADQFSLSRQGERLLRKTLKDEGADVVEALIEQLAVTMVAVQGESWSILQVQEYK